MEKIQLEGKYIFYQKNLIGQGSFAKVYKGCFKQKNIPIAIKVINKNKIKSNILLNVIKSEKDVLIKISKYPEQYSQNLIKIYDCFQTQTKIYMILQYCDGGTLDDVLLKKKKFSQQQAKEIIYQIIKGLYYMNKLEISHRDLKPQNIFISQNKYKIGDFGFASQKKMFQTTLGTYPYMAPQLFSNEQYDNRVDVWSLGIIFHYLLFGELYFKGDNQHQLKKNILNQPYQINNENISQKTKNFLMRCFQKNKNNRIKVEQLINHPLFKDFEKKEQKNKIKKKVSNDQHDKILTMFINQMIKYQFMFIVGESITFQQIYITKYALLKKCMMNIISPQRNVIIIRQSKKEIMPFQSLEIEMENFYQI